MKWSTKPTTTKMEGSTLALNNINIITKNIPFSFKKNNWRTRETCKTHYFRISGPTSRSLMSVSQIAQTTIPCGETTLFLGPTNAIWTVPVSYKVLSPNRQKKEQRAFPSHCSRTLNEHGVTKIRPWRNPLLHIQTHSTMWKCFALRQQNHHQQANFIWISKIFFSKIRKLKHTVLSSNVLRLVR